MTTKTVAPLVPRSGFQARLKPSVRGAADQAAHLMRCKSSAVHGPLRTASLAGAWAGNDPREARMEQPRRPYGRVRSGRSDRGGEHLCGPAHACRNASRDTGAVRQSLDGGCGAPPRSARGDGRGRGGSHGARPSTSRRGRGPRTPGKRGRTPSGTSSSQQGLTATGLEQRCEGPTATAGGLRTGACVRRSQASGVTPTDLGRDPMTQEVTPCSGQGALGPGPFQESSALVGRGTRERPGKSTMACRGGCAAARQLRAVWAGARWEAKVSTGRGQAPGPGAQGGLRQRRPWWNEAPTSRIARARVGNSPPQVVRAADLSRPRPPETNERRRGCLNSG